MRNIYIYYVHRLEDSIAKMSVFPNLHYRFFEIPFKIAESYFVDIRKVILQFHILYRKVKDIEQVF